MTGPQPETDSAELAFAREEEPVEPWLPPERPRRRFSLREWLRRRLFGGPFDILLTLVCAWLLIQTVPGLVDWAFVSAVWSGDDPAVCRGAEGACWALIGAKHRFMLFGLYPYEEQWRPLVATVLFVGTVAVSCLPVFWRPWLALLWVTVIAACALLMWGGVFGLPFVDNSRWGGLPLTLILAVIGMVASFPLAVLLALGRRSELPAIRAISVGFIELFRGVPLISVLFMASVMLPLFLPEGVTIDKLLRAQIGIILFTGAYLAEAVRGGLQSVPRGQYEAADALGLGYWQKTRLIILPQALKVAIPPIVNQFISMFKDTSLVIVIGLYDLLTTVKTALVDPPWRPFYVEGYVFAAAIYFVFCFFMSRYSLHLEARLETSHRRPPTT